MIVGCNEPDPWVFSGGLDLDLDGINDQIEEEISQEYAPVLFLPHDMDWTYPGNVDWYISKTQMKFHHSGLCNQDHYVFPPIFNQTDLISQTHREFGWSWYRCVHKGIPFSSGPVFDWSDGDHFYLQHRSDSTHAGPSTPADWIIYSHTYQNRLGGVTIQYWFFYPYNDGFSGQNHEGDWENISVVLDGFKEVRRVDFYSHGERNPVYPADVVWHEQTHPMVWSSDGSHASYPSEGDCDNALLEGLNDSCCSHNHHRWFTWQGGRGEHEGYQGGGTINVGELSVPFNQQYWVGYSDRWGEIGLFRDTSGPLGPAFKDSWKFVD